MRPVHQHAVTAPKVGRNLDALNSALVQTFEQVGLALEAGVGHRQAGRYLTGRRRYGLVEEPAAGLMDKTPKLVADRQARVRAGESRIVGRASLDECPGR